MAAAGPASNEEIASQLMMPQGIDLSSLGNLAAVLGVSQGLNLLVDKQQGIIVHWFFLLNLERHSCSEMEQSFWAFVKEQPKVLSESDTESALRLRCSCAFKLCACGDSVPAQNYFVL